MYKEEITKSHKRIRILNEFIKQYNLIELNTTHYNTYSLGTIAKWVEKAKGATFKFSLKIPPIISHYNDHINCRK